MPSRYPEFDPALLRLVSLGERTVSLAAAASPHRTGSSVATLIDGLPRCLAADTLRAVVAAVVEARRRERAVIWAMGAHVIKCGLSPVVIDLMQRRIITAVAANGAVAIHDAEVALWGRTSEDVEASLADGTFGMGRETGDFVNSAARRAHANRLGLGEALGEALRDAPNAEASVLAAAYRLGVPLTVHVALGTDIVHSHAGADGAAIGDASLRDFRILTEAMRGLSGGGVLFNVGSAVLLPEVLLKAMAALANLGALTELTGVNLDFLQLYRPTQQVVRRVSQLGGRGYALTGHHELLIPLLAAAILEAAAPPARGECLSRDALIEQLDRRRLLGHRIVFTNGCFDLIHAGHVRTLRAARALGDCLVVGLNSDASVQRLKGASRPLVPQAERAEVIGALECVDGTTVFDEDTPAELIRAIRPHLHVKGGDYRADALPEAGAVREAGGEVVILPLLPGHSTTRLADRMARDV